MPKPVSAYTMARLADDFARGDRRGEPGQPVHVLAHDWGSVGHLGVPDPARRRRPGRVVHLGVGPSADHYKAAIFDSLKRPYRPMRFATALIAGFCGSPTWCPFSVPVRRARGRVAGCCGAALRRGSLTDGIPAEQRYRCDTVAADAATH